MPGSKLHEKEIHLCKRMEDGKAEYEASVQHINSLQQDMIGSQLPKVQIDTIIMMNGHIMCL